MPNDNIHDDNKNLSLFFKEKIDLTKSITALELSKILDIAYIKDNYKLQEIKIAPDFQEIAQPKFDIDEFSRLVNDALHVKCLADTNDNHLLYYNLSDGTYKHHGSQKVGLLIEAVSFHFDSNIKINIHLTNEIIQKCKRQTHISFKELDNHDNLLNTLDGIILKDKLPIIDIIPHSHEYLFTYCIPRHIKEDPNIEEKIYNILKETVYSESLINLYELASYLFVPSGIHKKMVLTLGEGDAGKTSYTTLLSNMLGDDLKRDISLDRLTKDEFALADTQGKWLILDDDVTKKALADTSLLKKITGGKSKYVSARKIHIGYIDFPILFKVFGNTNKLFVLKDEQIEDAFFNRIWVIDFPFIFKDNPDKDYPKEKQAISKRELTELFANSDILDVFFTKILGFYKDVLDNGITATENMNDVKNKWLKNSDSLFNFVDSMLSDNSNCYEVKEDIYEQSKLFLDSIGESPRTKGQVTQAIYKYCKLAREHRPRLPKAIKERPLSIKGIQFKYRLTSDFEALELEDDLNYQIKYVDKVTKQKEILV